MSKIGTTSLLALMHKQHLLGWIGELSTRSLQQIHLISKTLTKNKHYSSASTYSQKVWQFCIDLQWEIQGHWQEIKLEQLLLLITSSKYVQISTGLDSLVNQKKDLLLKSQFWRIGMVLQPSTTALGRQIGVSLIMASSAKLLKHRSK